MRRYLLAVWGLLLTAITAVHPGESPVTLKINNPPLAGGVYVAEFWAAGGGEQLTVRENGKSVPFRVLADGPADARKIAFQCKDPAHVRLVALNGAPAAAEKKKTTAWLPRSGLLLTTWPLPPDTAADNIAQMRQMLVRCAQDRPFGSGFVDNVFHAHNLFGPSETFVSRYEGWLNCPESGEYIFATSSDDASFLLIDDKEIVSWPGGHGAVWDARHQNKCRLDKGWHKFTYLHVNFAGPSITCAAWQTPTGKKIVPIPAGAFGKCPPIIREIIRKDGAPLIAAKNSGELWRTETPLLQYTFTLSTGEKAQWHFGDGNSGNDGVHLYLTRDVQAVTAVFRQDGKERRVTARIAIVPDWAASGNVPLVPPLSAAQRVAGYNFTAMELSELGEAVELLQETAAAGNEKKPKKTDERLTAALLAAARAYLACAAKPAGEVSPGENERRRRIFLLAGELLRANPATLPEALALYRSELSLAALPDVWRAEVIRQYGDTLFYYAHDLAGALNQYDMVVGRYAEVMADNIVRVTEIKIGDIHWQCGRTEAALNAYRAADQLKLVQRDFSQDTVRKGALYKAVDDFLRRHEYPAAEEWLGILEWEYPLEKVYGYATIARARLAQAQNRMDEAEKQLRLFVDTGPKNAYTAEALYRLQNLYTAAGRTAEAGAIAARLKRDFPDSVYVMGKKK